MIRRCEFSRKESPADEPLPPRGIPRSPGGRQVTMIPSVIRPSIYTRALLTPGSATPSDVRNRFR